jgi:hypothetical protein
MRSPLLAELLPLPRECRFTGDGLRLGPKLRLWHTVAANEPDHRAAALLADALAAATGVRPRLAATTRYVHRHVLRLAADDKFDIPHDFAPSRHEGYGLRVDSSGALLVGADAAGLFYAVQTLAQTLRLRRTAGCCLPGMAIRDWPALRHRAVMVDIARQVERADYLETFVRDMAALKKNMFVLYLEDKFRWRRHPAISHPLGYTHEEFARLARVAEEHHVEFVPALPCLGHCEGILQHDVLAPLRTDGAIYQLSLRHCGTRELLAEQIAEMLPLYRGRFFHVNCDESPLLAGPPGSPKGYFRESLKLFAAHLIFLHDLLARDGRRIMVWGDMLLHHPEIAAELPRDIVIVDWDYGSMATRRREAPAWFREQGFDVMVAPASCRSAEVYYPPFMQMSDNVPHFIRQGFEAGAIGEMTTMWEMRSTNPVVGWPGVVASAQAAWDPTAVPASALPRRVAANLYGPDAAAYAVRAWRHLGGDRFFDRYAHEARHPQMPGRRTYHVDFHEFVATDPLLFLTYEQPTWAQAVVAEAARGVAAAEAARTKARWAAEGLHAAMLSGVQQAVHGHRRAAINHAGLAVVAAERLRRRGKFTEAAAKVSEAAEELSDLTQLIAELIEPVYTLWLQTRQTDDPAWENLYGRRMTLDIASLRQHVARLERARRRLAAGRDVDLSQILGGQEAVLIEAHNPSTDLIDILQAQVAASDDGRRWRDVCNKGWFILKQQTYTVPLILGPTLPVRLRMRIRRTHINPRRFPLADRLRVSVARTLTPGEILDGPPQADLATTDWRLVRVWSRTYRCTKAKGWHLEYELTDVGT